MSFKLLEEKRWLKSYFNISLCICVVLSWDELKVWQNLLASCYEIYIVCLLVATIYWYKLLQFVKKSSITLLPCLLLIRSVVKERVHASAKFRNTPRDKTKQNKTKQNTKKLCTVRYQSRSKWDIEGFSLRWAEVKLKLNFSSL